MRFSLKGEMEKILLLLIILNFCFLSVLAAPLIDFTNPTPNDDFITTNTSVEINISISEANLGSLIYNWNTTNFSLYDGSLLAFFNLNNNSKIGDSSSKVIDSSIYNRHAGFPIFNDFEYGVRRWVARDGNWVAPARDCTTSTSGSCSVKTTTTTTAAGSIYIDNTASTYPRDNLNIEFDYKCESGIKWGVMFLDAGVSWGCIQGSGTSNCGSASFVVKGAFSPAITCDNTWRHANYSVNWGAGTVSYPIIGDWDGANTANKWLWFDNFSISTSSAVYNSGKYEIGLSFDGTDDHISADGFSEIGTVNQPYSFTGWFNVATGETNGDILFSEAVTGWCLPPVSLVNSKVRGYSWVNPTGTSTVTGTTTISSGEWYFFANTWDPTNGLNIYVNGQLEGTTAQANYLASGGSNTIWIGGVNSAYSGCAGYIGPFNGTIDEVSVWNKSLSASEVYQLYVSNLQKFNSTQWYLYVNQSKNATTGLNLGLYNYQTFATNSSGSLSSTEQRTIDISTSICPSSKRNWNINMKDNLLINSLCNITGYNVTFSGTGNFTINNTFYFNEMNNLSSGMTIWIKPNGILYSGAN